jgi:hypothetical protein
VHVRLQVSSAWEAVVCIALAALMAWADAVPVAAAAAAGVKTVAGALLTASLSLQIRQPTIGPLA